MRTRNEFGSHRQSAHRWDKSTGSEGLGDGCAPLTGSSHRHTAACRSMSHTHAARINALISSIRLVDEGMRERTPVRLAVCPAHSAPPAPSWLLSAKSRIEQPIANHTQWTIVRVLRCTRKWPAMNIQSQESKSFVNGTAANTAIE